MISGFFIGLGIAAAGAFIGWSIESAANTISNAFMLKKQ